MQTLSNKLQKQNGTNHLPAEASPWLTETGPDKKDLNLALRRGWRVSTAMCQAGSSPPKDLQRTTGANAKAFLWKGLPQQRPICPLQRSPMRMPIGPLH